MQDRDAQERGPHSASQVRRSHPGAVPSDSRMLTNYLADIEQLLCEQRWEAALREACDLPQIAVALADPTPPKGYARSCPGSCLHSARPDPSPCCRAAARSSRQRFAPQRGDGSPASRGEASSCVLHCAARAAIGRSLQRSS